MESSLNILRDPSIISELNKTLEGKTIVEKMLQLAKQLENLADKDKQKFESEFRDQFSSSLGKLLEKDGQNFSLDSWLTVLAVLAAFLIITFLGNFYIDK